MTVTNRSSVAAADVNGVKVDDPRSFRTRLISLHTSQGTCRPYTCDLGRLAPGASATVIAVTEATQVGRRRRHRARRLRGGGVELPQQRRGGDRAGRRAARPLRVAEPLPHAGRRAQSPRRTGDRRSCASPRGTVGAGQSRVSEFARAARVSTTRGRPTVGAACAARSSGRTAGWSSSSSEPRATATGGGVARAGRSSASSARTTRSSPG